MRALFCSILLLLGLHASAQTPAATPCGVPTVHLFAGAKEITAAGSPFTPKFTVKLVGDPACPEKRTYTLANVEVTLARDRTPVTPTKYVSGPEVDLTAWTKLYQPGDRLYVEVTEMVVTGPAGKKLPVDAKAKHPSLNWFLVK